MRDDRCRECRERAVPRTSSTPRRSPLGTSGVARGLQDDENHRRCPLDAIYRYSPWHLHCRCGAPGCGRVTQMCVAPSRVWRLWVVGRRSANRREAPRATPHHDPDIHPQRLGSTPLAPTISARESADEPASGLTTPHCVVVSPTARLLCGPSGNLPLSSRRANSGRQVQR